MSIYMQHPQYIHLSAPLLVQQMLKILFTIIVTATEAIQESNTVDSHLIGTNGTEW
jgi:hypothetical protein